MTLPLCPHGMRVSNCKTCRRAYKTAKQRIYKPPTGRKPGKPATGATPKWILWLKNRHGMRPEDWQQLWDDQHGCCYLCELPLPISDSDRQWISVDHDHGCCPRNSSCSTCRRGLAHDRCNKGIGFAQDDADKVMAWAVNLQRAQAKVNERKSATAQQICFDLL